MALLFKGLYTVGLFLTHGSHNAHTVLVSSSFLNTKTFAAVTGSTKLLQRLQMMGKKRGVFKANIKPSRSG